MKKLLFVLFIAIIFFGLSGVNRITHTPSILLYYNGVKEHCDYLSINDLSNLDGYYPYAQVHPYKGNFNSMHFVHKRNIDSIIVLQRNFFTDGLPKRKIINNRFPAMCGKDTVWIKMVDLTD